MLDENAAVLRNSGSQYSYYSHFNPDFNDNDLNLFFDPASADPHEAIDINGWRPSYD